MRIDVVIGPDGRMRRYVDGVEVAAARGLHPQPQPGTHAAAEAAREVKPVSVTFKPLPAKAGAR